MKIKSIIDSALKYCAFKIFDFYGAIFDWVKFVTKLS